MSEALRYRQSLTNAKRIVVKVGTRILVDKNGLPNRRRIATIAQQLAALRKSGKEVVLVSSGAVGAGLQVLGMKRKPKSIPDLQMAASVGQTRLLEIYSQHFSKAGCCISQVLLTHADLRHRGRHLNARNTMLKLLSYGVIPIVNENDVVSVDEIRVGDNDILSSLVTVLIDADLLILLTSPDGLRQPSGTKTKRVPFLPSVTAQTYELVTKKTEELSTGGMATKLQAAKTAAKVGSVVVIACGRQSGIIKRVIEGEDVGTLIGNQAIEAKLDKRKQWIAYFHHSKGVLLVDAGAMEALLKNKSLLPVGIKKVIGQFSVGDQVEIKGPNNAILGRGLVEYNSAEIDKIKGKTSFEIQNTLGFKVTDVVIHRDNLVVENDY